MHILWYLLWPLASCCLNVCCLFIIVTRRPDTSFPSPGVPQVGHFGFPRLDAGLMMKMKPKRSRPAGAHPKARNCANAKLNKKDQTKAHRSTTRDAPQPPTRPINICHCRHHPIRRTDRGDLGPAIPHAHLPDRRLRRLHLPHGPVWPGFGGTVCSRQWE